MREAFWTPLCSAAVARVLWHGFPPPLNPVVLKTTCTLRTDTDITKSWDLAHKSRVVISDVKHIHTERYKVLRIVSLNIWPRSTEQYLWCLRDSSRDDVSCPPELRNERARQYHRSFSKQFPLWLIFESFTALGYLFAISHLDKLPLQLSGFIFHGSLSNNCGAGFFKL